MSSSEGNSEESGESWVEWFCSLSGNQYFCKVDHAYISDAFNLFGLKQLIPQYTETLRILLDYAESRCDNTMEEDELEVSKRTQLLYGLIHSRFIITNRGLEVMAQLFTEGAFGVCPREFCQRQGVLPIGISDIPDEETFRLYCPRCRDLYRPRGRFGKVNELGWPLDGAYFGTTFAPLFFLRFPELEPEPETTLYVPRVFGYRIKDKGPVRVIEDKKKRKEHEEEARDKMAEIALHGGSGAPVDGELRLKRTKVDA